jgi:hypothetical protein
LVDESDLAESFKNRIKRSTDPFLSPSGSDLLHSFVVKFGLDKAIHDAWKKSRHPAAHGNLIDLSRDDTAKIVDRRNKVLYLCYAIILDYIGYAGPHTRYDVLGYPVTVWKQCI